MEDKKKNVIRLSQAIFLAASLMALVLSLTDTGDVVKIMVEPKENEASLDMDYFFASPALINGVNYVRI